MVDIVYDGRIIEIQREEAIVNKRDIQSVFQIIHDNDDNIIFKTPTSLYMYTLYGEGGMRSIMSSSSAFSLLGAGDHIWIMTKDKIMALNKDGTTQASMETDCRPVGSFCLKGCVYIDSGTNIMEYTITGDGGLEACNIVDHTLGTVCISSWGQIASLRTSTTISMCCKDDWSYNHSECKTESPVNHIMWMGDDLVASAGEKLMLISAAGNIKSIYSITDISDIPIDLKCDSTWGAVATHRDVIIFDQELSPKVVIHGSYSACCVFGGALFLSTNAYVEMYAGSPTSTIYDWPREIHDWSIGINVTMKSCMSVGTSVISTELKSNIMRWISESPSVEGCNMVMPFILESDEIKGAFIDNMRKWVDTNAEFISDRLIWRTQFKITSIITGGGVPVSIIEILKARVTHAAALAEFIHAWGPEPLGCRNIIAQTIDNGRNPLALEILGEMMNSSHAECTMEMLASLSSHERINPFDVVTPEALTASMCDGLAMKWLGQFNIALSNTPNPSIRLQSLFDTAVDTVSAANFLLGDIRPAIRAMNMTRYSMNPRQSHLCLNWLETTLISDFEKVENISEFVNCMSALPMTILTRERHRSGVRASSTNLDGIYLAFLYKVEHQKYLGSETRSTLRKNFVTTAICAWGNRLVVAGHDKHSDASQYIRVWNTSNMTVMHRTRISHRVTDLIMTHKLLWCHTMSKEVFSYHVEFGRVHERLRKPMSCRPPQVLPIPPPPRPDEFVRFKAHGTAGIIVESDTSRCTIWRQIGMSYIKRDVVERCKFALPVGEERTMFLADNAIWYRKHFNCPIQIETPPNFVPTAVSSWNDHVVIGTSTGIIYLLKHDDKVCETFYDVGDEITHLHVDGSLLYASTVCGVCAISVTPWRPARALKALKTACRRNVEWRKAVTNISRLGEFLKYMPRCAELVDVIDLCRGDSWNEKCVDVLVQCAHRNIRTKVVSRVLSDMVNENTTQRFMCLICRSRSVREEGDLSISVVTKCMHRFHTKCIYELVRKTPDADAEMRREYALQVPLKCPACRKQFNEDDICRDVQMTQMCLYDSD